MRGNRNSDGWQKCFTNVPPGASRGSADLNVKNVFSGICDFDFDFNLGMVAMLQKIGAFWYNN